MWGLSEFVEESLPTPWSRRVATLTGSLAGLIVLLPQWWASVVGPNPIEQPTLLVRLFLLTTTLFLGALITLALVVRDHRRLSKQLEEIKGALKENILMGVAKIQRQKEGPLEPEAFND